MLWLCTSQAMSVYFQIVFFGFIVTNSRILTVVATMCDTWITVIYSKNRQIIIPIFHYLRLLKGYSQMLVNASVLCMK